MLLPIVGLAILPFALLVWLNDRGFPIYAGPRIGRDWRPYRQYKLRSMTERAEASGVDATPADDPRITPIGRLLRRTKLDELPQIFNVLVGSMSFVGPRPNCLRECLMYSDVEQRILTIRPGITDLASIVFADEERILKGAPDPDLAYHQLVRPWKSRLCLLYIDKQSLRLDVELIVVTTIALASRRLALRLLQPILRRLGADRTLLEIARREVRLRPHPPPGLDEVVGEVAGKGLMAAVAA